MAKRAVKQPKKKKQSIKHLFDSDLMKEIISIFFIGLGSMLFFSVFSDKMGAFGFFTKKVLISLTGLGAYAFPFFVLAYAIWYMINKPNSTKLLTKIVYGTIILLLFVTECQLFFSKRLFLDLHSTVFSEKLSYFVQHLSLRSGGLLGFFISELLLALFGLVGSLILINLSALCLLMLIFDISFYNNMGQAVQALGQLMKSKKNPKNKPYPYQRKKLSEKEIEKNIAIVIHDEQNETEPDFQEPLIEDIKINKPIPQAVLNHEIFLKKNDYQSKNYEYPPFDLLRKGAVVSNQESKTQMLSVAKKLEETLKSFGVEAKVTQINKGPAVTRYELSPSQGVKVSKIVSLSDDIALNLAAFGIRIEAPIPGKSAVGIEVPNKEVQPVFFRDVAETEEFLNYQSKLAISLGKDISGNPIVTDIAKMPHLLIAGATGSGKSVCINTIITSILYKSSPDEVKLLMIDPKVVELSVYNGIPHLLIPVVTDPKKAASALNWAVAEMLERYKIFAEHNVRDIVGFNKLKEDANDEDFMCHMVIIIDELADLMMVAPSEVEESICRLAQMARAAGIHLIIATQRPSVDVITGVIKANIPSRLAFAVSSGTDSRTILDMVGAEKLLGKGDMLFYPVGLSKPLRIQGAYITEKEVEKVVDYIKQEQETKYDDEMIQKITTAGKDGNISEDSDKHLIDAIAFVIEREKASISSVQRQFKIGYNRAANIIEDMEKMGVVGPEDGVKGRKVLWTRQDLDELIHKNMKQ